MEWFCKYYDCNANKINDINILRGYDDYIKKLKKKCATKEQFAEELRREMIHRFWSKSEWELIIEIDDNDRVWLTPWCGCSNPQDVRIDVTDDDSFDWRGFAEVHIGKQIYKYEAKVDIYDQLTFKDRFEQLVTYLWATRLKYARDNPKFHT